MLSNLGISFFEYPKSKKEIKYLEEELIKQLVPIFNIDKNSKNPFASQIKVLRKESARLAIKNYVPGLQSDCKDLIIDHDESSSKFDLSKGKYISLWRSCLNCITELLQNDSQNQTIQLNKSEFEKVGNRKSYSFNLEYKNGLQSNNINGTAVARDLDEVLCYSQDIKTILQSNDYKINMDRDFVLHINKLNQI